MSNMTRTINIQAPESNLASAPRSSRIFCIWKDAVSIQLWPSDFCSLLHSSSPNVLITKCAAGGCRPLCSGAPSEWGAVASSSAKSCPRSSSGGPSTSSSVDLEASPGDTDSRMFALLWRLTGDIEWHAHSWKRAQAFYMVKDSINQHRVWTINLSWTCSYTYYEGLSPTQHSPFGTVLGHLTVQGWPRYRYPVYRHCRSI